MLFDSLRSVFSSWFVRTVFGLLLALLIFWLGMQVGFRRASFSYRWGDRYEQNFGRHRSFFGMPGMMFGGDFVNGYGVVGDTLSVQNGEVMLKTDAGIEADIVITPQTTIRERRDQIAWNDIHVGDRLVVIGAPDAQGKIQARFIRVMFAATR